MIKVAKPQVSLFLDRKQGYLVASWLVTWAAREPTGR
jgi:hypothetical protein